MSDLYSNTAVREHAEMLVRREVIYCVSSLVSSLAQSEDAQRGLGVDYEDLMAILSRDDWEEPARDWIRSAAASELSEACEELDCEPSDDAAGMRAMIVAALEESDDWQEFCEDRARRIEPYATEAYEHWIVSDWMAAKLEARGEMVARDLLGLTIWGRPTTGQAISMDSVILAIAHDALKA